jgi:hypothetical protein
MKLHILRLGSVVPEGVGGPEAGSIDLIYSYLLQEYNCAVYPHIHINQIGDELEELVMKMSGKMRVNIKYPSKGFDSKSKEEKNLIRLNVVHTALLRIAEKEKKLDVIKLEKIKERILEQHFEFDFIYKQFEDQKDQTVGKILIHPLQDKFCFYFSVEKNGAELTRILLYEGKSTPFYIPDIFYKGKWKSRNQFIISSKNKEEELHVLIDENRVEVVNLTKYKNPPFFEMMKAGERSEEAYKDWLHSLPPGAAGAITFEPN